MQTIPIPFLLADAAPAGGTAASSAVGVAIVGLVFLACLALAVRAGLRHLRGEGGCCGGRAAPPPAPAGKAIGPEVARRTLELSGLHCMKCVARVKAALEALPGVAADVTLDPQRAVVRLDREVPDEALRKAVEALDFQVVSLS